MATIGRALQQVKSQLDELADVARFRGRDSHCGAALPGCGSPEGLHHNEVTGPATKSGHTRVGLA